MSMSLSAVEDAIALEAVMLTMLPLPSAPLLTEDMIEVGPEVIFMEVMLLMSMMDAKLSGC